MDILSVSGFPGGFMGQAQMLVRGPNFRRDELRLGGLGLFVVYKKKKMFTLIFVFRTVFQYEMIEHNWIRI